jgi:hypothetical protein
MRDVDWERMDVACHYGRVVFLSPKESRSVDRLFVCMCVCGRPPEEGGQNTLSGR